MHTNERLQSLDGARGLGFLLVLVAHTNPQRFMLMGIAGVVFFFTLSGYLITKQICRSEGLGSYYSRRLTRIMPLAYLYLIINGLAAIVAGRPVDGYGWHFAFFSDWLLASQAPLSIGGVVGHLWTIAVEVQFYIIWPAILLPAGRHRVRVLLVLVVAAFVWRLSIANPLIASLTLPSRVDAFAIGGLVALSTGSLWRPWAFCVGVTLVTVGLVTQQDVDFSIPASWGGHAAILLSGLALTCGACVSHLAERGAALLQVRPLVWCGERAYSLYIWHVPILIAGQKLPIPEWLRFLVSCVAIGMVSWVSHRWIEVSVTKWLNNSLRSHSARKRAPVHPI